LMIMVLMKMNVTADRKSLIQKLVVGFIFQQNKN